MGQAQKSGADETGIIEPGLIDATQSTWGRHKNLALMKPGLLSQA